jgi:hypothetical protein
VRRIALLGAIAFLIVFGQAAPTQAQPAAAPLDLFSTHFGGARQPVRASGVWGGASVLSLTQFDGRWREDATASPDPLPPGAEFERYGDLDTTVGYVYGTLGRSWLVQDVRLPWGEPFEMTVSSSLHGGRTSDSPPRKVQDGIHDLLGVTHVLRDHVSDGDLLLGGDFEVLAWPSGLFSGHLALGVSGSWGTFHRELGARVHVMDVRICGLRAGASAGAALLSPTGTQPERVAAMVRSDWYHSFGFSLTHPQIGGLQFTRSSNIYREKPEQLVSLFVDAPFDSRWRLRVEFVNDLLADKDRGPTGGGRIFVSRGG